MFHFTGSFSSATLRRRVVAGDFCNLRNKFNKRPMNRKQVSSLASEKNVTTLRSWKTIATPKTFSRWNEPFREGSTQNRRGIKRTYFSRSSQYELEESSSQFSPLEDCLMDAMAWTVAVSLWYILRIGVDFGDEGNSNDSDSENNSRLEYREDYGPSVSPWPATTPTPTSKRNPNNSKKEGKQEK